MHLHTMTSSPKRRTKKYSNEILSDAKEACFFDKTVGLLVVAICILLLSTYMIANQGEGLKYFANGVRVKTEEERMGISNSEQKIEAISILGERNSGTTWIYE
jgi:hypothetical protein